eukprot:Colp12_sorted_trinity150504_noHs@16653
MKMSQKVCIITGANTGIGKETARGLAALGYHVILACRSLERTQPAIDDIKASTSNENVEFMKLDLASLASVREFAAAFLERKLPLHLLVNNAALGSIPHRDSGE